MPLHERSTNTTHTSASKAGQSASAPRQDCLITDDEAWPPFFPSFSGEVVQTIASFVDLFLTQTIQFRCGQLPGSDFVEVFLAQWLNVALRRQRQLEHLLTAHGGRLSSEQAYALAAALGKLRSAARDAEQELSLHRHRDPEKAVSFARPLAYRVARRSNDRLSIRSLSEGGEPFHSSEGVTSSPAPHRLDDPSGPPAGVTHSPAPTPPPLTALTFDALDAEACETSEEHFTGRASGVFYGDIFHSDTTSANKGHRASGGSQAQPEEAGSSELDALVRKWEGKRKGRSTRRLLWYLMVYWVLPMATVLLTGLCIAQRRHSASTYS